MHRMKALTNFAGRYFSFTGYRWQAAAPVGLTCIS